MAVSGRAETTRTAILDAARAQFGREGYERTTIRSVASHVGVDPALVMRYFRNKEGLFAEAAQFDLHLPDLAGASAADLPALLIPRFFAVWEGDPTFLPLLRAAATSRDAAATMREIFAQQVAPALAAVAPDRAAERAALVGAQILGLAFARYILEIPPVAGLSSEQLIAWVGPVLRHYLTGELGAGVAD